MASRLPRSLRAAATLGILGAAAAGFVSAFRAIAARDATEEAAADAARAASLERARTIVPKGARVLAIQARVPALDFDYWFGLETPVAILVPFSKEVAPAGAPEADVAAIEAELARRGVLFTQAALDAELIRVDFVVAADAASERALQKRLGRLELVAQLPSLRIFRVKGT